MPKFCLEAEGQGFSSPKRSRIAEPEEQPITEEGNNNQFECRGTATNTISVTIDSDLLDCAICMEPLIPPVFQCENGHIMCSSCCTKLNNKCHSCYLSIGNTRCLAIEKVIESVKTTCQHAHYGCKVTINYAQKHAHEEMCPHTPFTCPILDCTFRGSSQQLSLHFRAMHWASVCFFLYNSPFPVSLDKGEKLLVLHGEDGFLFLLNNRIESLGNAVMVSFIGPSSPNGGFAYELMVRNRGRNLRLQSFAMSIKQSIEGSSTDFLLIPWDVYCCDGKLKLEVRIWSCKEVE